MRFLVIFCILWTAGGLLDAAGEAGTEGFYVKAFIDFLIALFLIQCAYRALFKGVK